MFWPCQIGTSIIHYLWATAQGDRDPFTWHVWMWTSGFYDPSIGEAYKSGQSLAFQARTAIQMAWSQLNPLTLAIILLLHGWRPQQFIMQNGDEDNCCCYPRFLSGKLSNNKKRRLENGKGTAILVHCTDVICLTNIKLAFNFFRWIKKQRNAYERGTVMAFTQYTVVLPVIEIFILW